MSKFADLNQKTISDACLCDEHSITTKKWEQNHLLVKKTLAEKKTLRYDLTEIFTYVFFVI